MPNGQPFAGPAGPPEDMQQSGEYHTQQYGGGSFPPSMQPNGNDTVKVIGAKWLFSQNKDTVALYLILGCIILGGYFAATSWIPNHLKQIHNGYVELSDKGIEAVKEIADKNRESHKAIAESHAKDLDKTIQAFDKSVDRIERSYNEGYKAAANRNAGP